uniref:G protein-coupled receptor n=1 Tax=Azumapecten farreri TaxID=106299 RepID=J9PCL8_AZUFA|nr:G protein-coupled receptor [Azumapecten farreri]
MSGDLSENAFGGISFGYLVFYISVFFFLTLIIVGGNFIIIVTVLRHRDLQQPCNYMIASLAVSDLIFGFIYPLYNLGHIRDSSVSRFLASQAGVCVGLITAIQWIEMNSAYHLVAITVNRYIAIVRPLKYHVYLTSRTVIVTLCTIWLTTLATSTAIYSTGDHEGRGKAEACRYELLFTETQSIALAVLSGVVPLSVMVVLYTIIARIARKHIRDIAACCGSESLGKQHVLRREMRSTLTVSILVGYFAFAWLPHCFYLIYSITCQCRISPYIRLSSRILVYTNNAINIFIYAGRIHLFRKFAVNDIKQLCSSCFKKQ